MLFLIKVFMILFVFQLFLFFLVIFSFFLVLTIPIFFASPSSWENNKKLVLLGSSLWTFLVLTVGLLNYMVV